MTHFKNYNNTIDTLKQLGANQLQIKTVTTGDIYEIDLEKNGKHYSITAYNGSEVRMRAEKFKKMKAKDVHSSLVFFWTLGNELSKILPLYLTERANQMIQSLQATSSQKSGDGSE